MLRVLRLYLKTAIFKPELPRTRGDAGLRKQARKPRDNFQRPFREQEYCTAPQRERFDTHKLRRGFAESKTNSHGATARALRRARSPQRVARGLQKSQKVLNLDHANLRRGSRAHAKNRKKSSVF